MKIMNKAAALAAALAFSSALSSAAFAQVTARDPWVRGTVAQMTATGAFMQLTAAGDARLVGAASPVAGLVEIHEMRMQDNVMRMRAVAGIDLPAGKTVELRPGGLHVMLMDLKRPLQEGDTVPLTLTIEAKDGTRSTLELQAPVRALTGRPGGQGMMQHKH